ncbi:MAG: ankyrin repeat domain-containing protein [Gaiellaceae bacterium]
MSNSSSDALIEAVIIEDVDEVNRVIADGADVNDSDKDGFTPLHFAAQNRSPEIASVLISAGANVNASDTHGNSPLWVAIFSYEGDGSIVQLLLDNKADPYHKNKAGNTPVGLARTIANYDVAKYFDNIP